VKEERVAKETFDEVGGPMQQFEEMGRAESDIIVRATSCERLKRRQLRPWTRGLPKVLDLVLALHIAYFQALQLLSMSPNDGNDVMVEDTFQQYGQWTNPGAFKPNCQAFFEAPSARENDMDSSP
jgi:hypothetical protein